MAITSTILMVRPAAFGFNAETAANNFFQSNPNLGKEELQQKALNEFDNMVATLRKHGVTIVVIQDTETPAKPDAIFPNNWLSTSPNGTVTVYPMFAPNEKILFSNFQKILR